MIRRILVPLDGSELAERVLPEVKDIARPLHANVHLIQAFDVTDLPKILLYGSAAPGPVGLEFIERVKNEERRKAEGYLSRLAGRLQEDGLDASWEAVEGSAAETIVEFAHSGGADLVAMSTHGRSGVDRAVFGSVAGEVLREVGIPVLLVKCSDRTAGVAGCAE